MSGSGRIKKQEPGHIILTRAQPGALGLQNKMEK